MSARLLALTMAAGAALAAPAGAQIGGCNTPTPLHVIFQDGTNEATYSSVTTRRNWDLCPWECQTEAWQAAPSPGVVQTARHPTAATVAWHAAGIYGQRSQSIGKHWLIAYYFDWVFLGMTSAEVTPVKPPAQCRLAGPRPADCGDECDSDGSREDACVRDGGTWDASQCACIYPQECDPDAEARCNDLCGTWDSEQCECAGGSSEGDRELCENDGCTWKPDCWCDCGERPELSKKAKRRPVASLFGQSHQVSCGASANAFARAMAGR